MKMTNVRSNHHWRQFKYLNELYEDHITHEIPDNYEHLDKEDLGDKWIVYKGDLFHVSDFMRLDNNSEWDGYIGFTAFSGLYIKLSNCGEGYKIAYFWN